jgi:hypothetical protein
VLSIHPVKPNTAQDCAIWKGRNASWPRRLYGLTDDIAGGMMLEAQLERSADNCQPLLLDFPQFDEIDIGGAVYDVDR